MAQNATATASFAALDGVTVLYEQGGSATPFTIQIDSETAVTVTPQTGGSANSPTGSVYVARAAGLGAATVKITSTGGTIVVSHVYAHRGDQTSGIWSWVAGTSGATVSAALDTIHLARIKAMQPHGIVYQLGQNDYSLQADPETFRSQVWQFVEQALNAAPKTVIVFLWTHSRYMSGTITYPEDAYKQVYRDLATLRPQNVMFVDTSNMLPLNGRAAGDTSDVYASRDGVHMNDSGHETVSDGVAELLARPPRVPARWPRRSFSRRRSRSSPRRRSPARSMGI
ncbi:MAG: SGNH/GDSL hydrolase family protein [Gordonia polyisoprenivorans]|nr:SGNH/GDSL hydrolase family protein [Gordonia polyisoprenivorans]